MIHVQTLPLIFIASIKNQNEYPTVETQGSTQGKEDTS